MLAKLFLSVTIFFAAMFSLGAIPGDGTHTSYTCPELRENGDDISAIDQTKVAQKQAAVDLTIWGDSLSELVQLYGAKEPGFFGSSTPAGLYGRDPYFIDSFADYFTIFGDSFDDPFHNQELGVSGLTSVGLAQNTTSGNNRCRPVHNQGLGNPGGSSDKTGARSLVMIGGNDNLFARAYIVPMLPFTSAHVNTNTLNHISKFIDWNLENGKSVLLQGNFPAKVTCVDDDGTTLPDNKSGCMSDYDPALINRVNLCAGGGPKPPPIPEIPWWFWLIPGAGEAALTAYTAQTVHVFKAWEHFLKRFGEKDTERRIEVEMSIAQACLNDRIGRELAPAYTNSGYGNRVFFHLLYNDFSKGRNDIYARNFWRPFDFVYEGGDPIHIGPLGYRHWAQKITPRLRSLGWSQSGAAAAAIDHNTAIPANSNLVSIFAIAKSVTGSGKTEIHNMNGYTSYRNWLSETATLLPEVGDNTNFISADFNGDGVKDVAVLFKSGTGSGKTEVHVMNGASNFQNWLLQEATVLHPVGDNVEFVPLDYNRDGVMDIAAIIKSGTGTGTTEIHVMDGANRFKSWLHQDRTPLHPTGAEFRFVSLDHNRDGFMDITAIKQSGTGTGTTEIHVLDGANGFRNWIFQDRSALGVTDERFDFISGDFNRDGIWDIAAIEKRGTNSGTTEVRILNGASNFANFILHTGTVLHETADNYTFAAGN